MKIAIVHDWLGDTRGGAEEVLIRMAQLYPKADIFCLTYSRKKYPELTGRRVSTSWLGKLPRILREKRGLLTLFAPWAIEHLDLAGYDLVISSSNSFAKGVHLPQKAKHICYCYSPMRYVWDYWPQSLEERAHNPLSRAYMSWLTHRLRLWDYYSAGGVDSWIAISKTVAARLRKYYGVSSTVIYSGITDTAAFWDPQATKLDYYITVSTLAAYKKVELAVRACMQSDRKLMVVGDGPERKKLEKLAANHPNIVFMGRVSNAEKIQYLQEARGLIFPSEEDFGIAPIEALAAGTPVIAYGKGGLTETIKSGQTGLFFTKQTVTALNKTLTEFESRTWDAKRCHQASQQFDLKVFDKAFTKEVTKHAR